MNARLLGPGGRGVGTAASWCDGARVQGRSNSSAACRAVCSAINVTQPPPPHIKRQCYPPSCPAVRVVNNVLKRNDVRSRLHAAVQAEGGGAAGYPEAFMYRQKVRQEGRASPPVCPAALHAVPGWGV